MLVQMPEIIYVSQFYVEQFIWTVFFFILSIYRSKKTLKRIPRSLKSSFVQFYIVDLQYMFYGLYDMGIFAASNGQGLHYKHASKQALISKKWSNPLNYRGFPRAFKHTCNKMQKLFASGSALKLTVNDYPLSLFIPLGFYLFGILTYPIIRIIHRKGVLRKFG